MSENLSKFSKFSLSRILVIFPSCIRKLQKESNYRAISHRPTNIEAPVFVIFADLNCYKENDKSEKVIVFHLRFVLALGAAYVKGEFAVEAISG